MSLRLLTLAWALFAPNRLRRRARQAGWLLAGTGWVWQRAVRVTPEVRARRSERHEQRAREIGEALERDTRRRTETGRA